MNYNEEILKLKNEKNAVILAHNYQLPEIQDIADFVGDSLGLSIEAAKTNAEMIVFCGVNFMAETAAIIAKNKKVIIPEENIGCSLAESINLEQLKQWKNENTDAIVVSYVNTTAEIKAESDYCVTSANAVKVVNSLPKGRKILFLPDQFLGKYVQNITGKEMEIWNGSCHVHHKIDKKMINERRNEFPEAEFIIHPECGCSSECLLKTSENKMQKTHIFSTEGMVNFVKKSESEKFVVATEIGMLHRLKKENPTKCSSQLQKNLNANT
jgi:quinolinate synthase